MYYADFGDGRSAAHTRRQASANLPLGSGMVAQRVAAAFFVGTVIGSCFIVCITVLLNRRDLSRSEMILDSLLYVGVMTILALRFNAAAQNALPELENSGITQNKQRILVVGEGLELSAYVSALTALPEHQFEIVGIVTPHRWHRTNTVGEYAILGSLSDIPDIVRDYGVTRILALKSTMTKLDLGELDWEMPFCLK